jgi:hypothetical protein
MSIFTVLKIIVSSFFENSVWVLAFFYLLNKTFENERLKLFSKYATLVVLVLLFLYSVIIIVGELHRRPFYFFGS